MLNTAQANSEANADMPWAYCRTEPTGIDWADLFNSFRVYLARIF